MLGRKNIASAFSHSISSISCTSLCPFHSDGLPVTCKDGRLLGDVHDLSLGKFLRKMFTRQLRPTSGCSRGFEHGTRLLELWPNVRSKLWNANASHTALMYQVVVLSGGESGVYVVGYLCRPQRSLCRPV